MPAAGVARSQACGGTRIHPCTQHTPAQSDIPPGRSGDGGRDWGLLHAATRLLREMLGVIDLAERAGTPGDRLAAERLARRCVRALACTAVAKTRPGARAPPPGRRDPPSHTKIARTGHPAPLSLPPRLLHDDMKESGLLPVMAKLIKKFSARWGLLRLVWVLRG